MFLQFLGNSQNGSKSPRILKPKFRGPSLPSFLSPTHSPKQTPTRISCDCFESTRPPAVFIVDSSR